MGLPLNEDFFYKSINHYGFLPTFHINWSALWIVWYCIGFLFYAIFISTVIIFSRNHDFPLTQLNNEIFEASGDNFSRNNTALLEIEAITRYCRDSCHNVDSPWWSVFGILPHSTACPYILIFCKTLLKCFS